MEMATDRSAQWREMLLFRWTLCVTPKCLQQEEMRCLAELYVCVPMRSAASTPRSREVRRGN